MRKIRLEKLNVLNYRNIREADLILHNKVNAFYGFNAQGKTNLLDAIFSLGYTKSYLSRSDADNIKVGESHFHLSTVLFNNEEQNELILAYSDKKKLLKKNGKDEKRLSKHIGFLPIVMISPYDSNLITGASDLRRKFLDASISFYDSEYLSTLLEYHKVLKQKNKYLKEPNPVKELVESLNSQMSKFILAIESKRQRFFESFNPYFKSVYGKLSNENESPELIYEPSRDLSVDLEDQLSSKLRDELRTGFSLLGPHRDDFRIMLKGLEAKKYASQGQQKSLLIALKLAKFAVLKEKIDTEPLLLLDDIFDKLDKQRVHNLMDILHEEGYGQLFVSHTNCSDLKEVFGESAHYFEVNDGIVNSID